MDMFRGSDEKPLTSNEQITFKVEPNVAVDLHLPVGQRVASQSQVGTGGSRFTDKVIAEKAKADKDADLPNTSVPQLIRGGHVL